MAEDRNERLQAFKLLKASHEKKIWLLRFFAKKLLPCWLRGRRNKCGQMHNGDVEAHSMVDLSTEMARSDKRIHMLSGAFQYAEIPPPLGRALVDEATGKAMRPCTGRAIESEQNMSRADQPILMHRVKLNAAPVRQNSRAANERNVVIVDDIKSPFQDFPNVR